MNRRRPFAWLSPGVALLLCVGGALAVAWRWSLAQRDAERIGIVEPPPPSSMASRSARIQTWTAQGESAVAELAELLGSGSVNDRRDAAAALENLGGKSAAALEPLLESLADEDVHVRESAMHALAQVAVERPRIVAAAAEQFTDPAIEVRLACGEVLESAAPEILDAARPLVRSQQADRFVLSELAKRRGAADPERIVEIRNLMHTANLGDALRAEQFELLVWLDGVAVEDLADAANSDIELAMLALQYMEIAGRETRATAHAVAARQERVHKMGADESAPTRHEILGHAFPLLSCDRVTAGHELSTAAWTTAPPRATLGP